MAQIVDPPDLLARWCRVTMAQARLAAGDADKVLVDIAAPPGDHTFATALERVVLARAMLASGRLDAVEPLLTPLVGPSNFLGTAVEARVLLALTAERQNRDTAALALLKVMGCDIIQGFLISKPLPLDAFAAFMNDDARLAHLDTLPRGLGAGTGARVT